MIRLRNQSSGPPHGAAPISIGATPWGGRASHRCLF